MKKLSLKIIAVTLTMFVLTACEKSETDSIKSIDGTYIGTLTDLNGLKSEMLISAKENATANITKIDDKTIEVHMSSNNLDTIFLLNYYEHRDSVNVCYTGDDFENMYGHMLGQGHMDGGMMNDMRKDETEWMHHMNDEHQDSDEHFGGFEMQTHTFGYQLNMMDGTNSYTLKFQGNRQ